jgi:hypothetical protein
MGLEYQMRNWYIFVQLANYWQIDALYLPVDHFDQFAMSYRWLVSSVATGQ